MTTGEHGPQRSCLGCRKVLTKDELLRYVLSPQGELLVDYRERLPGRGAYTCIDRKCIDEALRRKQFSRAFHREPLAVDADILMKQLTEQIRERILGLLGMARKTNQLSSGSSLVLDRLSAGAPIAFVLLAEDVSDGIGEKVIGRAERRSVPCYRMFDKELLGRVLGTAERSVLALGSGSLAAPIRLELERYQRIAGEC